MIAVYNLLYMEQLYHGYSPTPSLVLLGTAVARTKSSSVLLYFQLASTLIIYSMIFIISMQS